MEDELWNRKPLFSKGELMMHREAEYPLLIMARNNNPNPLYEFWRGKHKAFLLRAMEDGYYETSV